MSESPNITESMVQGIDLAKGFSLSSVVTMHVDTGRWTSTKPSRYIHVTRKRYLGAIKQERRLAWIKAHPKPKRRRRR